MASAETKMASAKGKSQLLKLKELPPYPTLLGEEMAIEHLFLSVLLTDGLNNFFLN